MFTELWSNRRVSSVLIGFNDQGHFLEMAQNTVSQKSRSINDRYNVSSITIDLNIARLLLRDDTSKGFILLSQSILLNCLVQSFATIVLDTMGNCN